VLFLFIVFVFALCERKNENLGRTFCQRNPPGRLTERCESAFATFREGERALFELKAH
jgi:hypothetical protein